jgi:hypothetical protein
MIHRSADHGHIIEIQARKDTGSALEELEKYGVNKVRSMRTTGDRFYTFSIKSLKAAAVETYDLNHNGKTISVIRSAGDATTDNNLDTLKEY